MIPVGDDSCTVRIRLLVAENAEVHADAERGRRPTNCLESYSPDFTQPVWPFRTSADCTSRSNRAPEREYITRIHLFWVSRSRPGSHTRLDERSRHDPAPTKSDGIGLGTRAGRSQREGDSGRLRPDRELCSRDENVVARRVAVSHGHELLTPPYHEARDAVGRAANPQNSVRWASLGFSRGTLPMGGTVTSPDLGSPTPNAGGPKYSVRWSQCPRAASGGPMRCS